MAMTDRLCQNRKCRYDGEQLLAYELEFHYEEVGAQNIFTSPAANTTGRLVDNIVLSCTQVEKLRIESAATTADEKSGQG